MTIRHVLRTWSHHSTYHPLPHPLPHYPSPSRTVFAGFSCVARLTLALARPLVAACTVLARADTRAVLPVAVLRTSLTTGGAHEAVRTDAVAGGHVTRAFILAVAHAVAVGAVGTLRAACDVTAVQRVMVMTSLSHDLRRTNHARNIKLKPRYLI